MLSLSLPLLSPPLSSRLLCRLLFLTNSSLLSSGTACNYSAIFWHRQVSFDMIFGPFWHDFPFWQVSSDTIYRSLLTWHSGLFWYDICCNYSAVSWHRGKDSFDIGRCVLKFQISSLSRRVQWPVFASDSFDLPPSLSSYSSTLTFQDRALFFFLSFLSTEATSRPFSHIAVLFPYLSVFPTIALLERRLECNRTSPACTIM